MCCKNQAFATPLSTEAPPRERWGGGAGRQGVQCALDGFYIGVRRVYNFGLTHVQDKGVLRVLGFRVNCGVLRLIGFEGLGLCTL